MEHSGRWLLRILLFLTLTSGVQAVPEEIYLPLAPSTASRWSDVAPAEVRLWIGKSFRPVREVTAVDSSTHPSSPLRRRLFLVHIDPRLRFREEFRSKRWIKRLVRELDPTRDFVAVYRAGALSRFSSDPEEIERLIDFFGTEFDRFNFGSQDNSDRAWFRPGSGPLVSGRSSVGRSADPSELLFHNHPGSLRDVVSSLARLRGRKILLQFGRELPFDAESVEYHHPGSALRWAQDARIVAYGVVPSAADGKISSPAPLQSWVEATGGQLLRESVNLQDDLRQILDQTSHYLVVGFDGPRFETGSFTPVLVEVSRSAETLRASGGYFDTVDADLPIHVRAFFSARTGDSRFLVPPLELQTQPSQPGGLMVELRFPLEHVEYEVIGGGPGSRLFQEVQVFVGLYGPRDQLLDFTRERFQLDFEREEAGDFFPRMATLKRVLESRTRARPAAVRAIVVVGQNRQISAGELLLTRDPDW